MSILYNKEKGIFHIKSDKTSYILQVLESGHVAKIRRNVPIARSYISLFS